MTAFLEARGVGKTFSGAQRVSNLTPDLFFADHQ